MSAQELSDTTRCRLQAYEGRYTEIASRSELSLSWLSKFANGHKDNPTVGSLQSLIDVLDALDREGAVAITPQPSAPAEVDVRVEPFEEAP